MLAVKLQYRLDNRTNLSNLSMLLVPIQVQTTGLQMLQGAHAAALYTWTGGAAYTGTDAFHVPLAAASPPLPPSGIQQLQEEHG